MILPLLLLQCLAFFASARYPKPSEIPLPVEEMDNWCPKFDEVQEKNHNEPNLKFCPVLVAPCVVYSFGISNNWLFDEAMLARGCHVYSFDPDPATIRKKLHPTRHQFFRLGIGAELTSSIPKGSLNTLYSADHRNYLLMRLRDLMAMFDHDHIDLLRTDVEGAEWSFLPSWLADNEFAHISQWLVEFHKWDNRTSMHIPDRMPEFNKMVSDVPMSIASISPNVYRPGLVFEYTYLNKRLRPLLQCDSPLHQYEHSVKVPRIIHYTNRDKNQTKWNSKHRAGVASWHKVLKEDEWEFKFWDDDNIRKFFNSIEDEELKPFVAVVKGLKHAIQVIDAWRYFAMYMYGGVYMDVDVLLLKDLSQTLDKADLHFPEVAHIHTFNRREKGHQPLAPHGVHVGNWFLASRPKHPFWLKMLDYMRDAVDNPEMRKFGEHRNVVKTTGPYALGNAIAREVVRDKGLQFNLVCSAEKVLNPVSTYSWSNLPAASQLLNEPNA